ALEAFAHQDLSFAKLVAELQPVRDTSHAPLFQIMFNVINVPVQVPNLTGLSVDYIEVDPGGAQYDLSCTMTDVPGHHRVTISYNTDLFDSDTITRFIGHYETLLKSIAAQPDQLISELPILTDAERQQLLVDWNNTHVDYPLEKCVHQLFEEQAGRTPDEVAVVGESIRLQAKQQVRYGDLNRWANQLDRHL
ncbi:MAG: condensation domain-containing protein, partial [Chloroflexi bacterium]|nr:condensation domain-containing protein [Chloroflexota bacterium]